MALLVAVGAPRYLYSTLVAPWHAIKEEFPIGVRECARYGCRRINRHWRRPVWRRCGVGRCSGPWPTRRRRRRRRRRPRRRRQLGRRRKRRRLCRLQCEDGFEDGHSCGLAHDGRLAELHAKCARKGGSRKTSGKTLYFVISPSAERLVLVMHAPMRSASESEPARTS